MLRQSLNVPVPGIGTHCDIHARFDASEPAWLGVYDRERHEWLTTSDRLGSQTFNAALAVLEARTVQP